jgi:hypothetical protein
LPPIGPRSNAGRATPSRAQRRRAPSSHSQRPVRLPSSSSDHQSSAAVQIPCEPSSHSPAVRRGQLRPFAGEHSAATPSSFADELHHRRRYPSLLPRVGPCRAAALPPRANCRPSESDPKPRAPPPSFAPGPHRLRQLSRASRHRPSTPSCVTPAAAPSLPVSPVRLHLPRLAPAASRPVPRLRAATLAAPAAATRRAKAAPLRPRLRQPKRGLVLAPPAQRAANFGPWPVKPFSSSEKSSKSIQILQQPSNICRNLYKSRKNAK